jgi:hypothetical protein
MSDVRKFAEHYLRTLKEVDDSIEYTVTPKAADSTAEEKQTFAANIEKYNNPSAKSNH